MMCLVPGPGGGRGISTMFKILDADDLKVIATGIIVILIIGVLLVLLAVAAGFAVAVFEGARGIW